jgi:hypothetical protein
MVGNADVAEFAAIAAPEHPVPVSLHVGTHITPFVILVISSVTRDFHVHFAIELTALMHTERWCSAPYVANSFMERVILKPI